MIDCLVFSKDRACQLDLLLRSVQLHAGDIYSSLTVLYTASSRDHLRGYGICFAEHADVRFVLETDFERQTRQWIRAAGDVISFLVDDDVFHRAAPTTEAIEQALDYAGVSLRGSDFDYPFSVDGNVYRNRDVQLLLARPFYSFRNPNEFEHAGHVARERLPFQVVIEAPSCLVGVPLNRVSLSSGLGHAGVHQDWLLQLYLHGRRLAVPQLEQQLEAHAQIELAWDDGAPLEVAA